jgi:ABC-type nickel/cobalt efflux system permease component RcnA
MMYCLMAIGSGLSFGALHVLTGPDHLAAVAPFSVRDRRRSWRAGLAWGLGHTGGVWLLAAAVWLFREWIPSEWLSGFSERIVGVVLILIGLWGLRSVWSIRIHAHEHEHDGTRHTHVHVHKSGGGHDHKNAHGHTHSALAVGALHGFAGAHHLIGVVPVFLLEHTLARAVYFVSYGVGAVISMTAFAWVLGLIAGRAGGRGQAAFQWMLAGTSLGAVLVGIIWLGRRPGA